MFDKIFPKPFRGGKTSYLDRVKELTSQIKTKQAVRDFNAAIILSDELEQVKSVGENMYFSDISHSKDF